MTMNAFAESGTAPPRQTSNQCATRGTSPSVTSSPAVSLPVIPIQTEAPQPYSTQQSDIQQAAKEVGEAWNGVKTNGLELGARLYKWMESEAFKPSRGGYGSDGEGLSGFLNVLASNGVDIPRHIADYWLAEYKFKQGASNGKPCPFCDAKFPSKSKVNKHINKAHPDVVERRRARHEARVKANPTALDVDAMLFDLEHPKVPTEADIKEAVNWYYGGDEQARVSRLNELEKAVETKTKEPFNSFRAAPVQAKPAAVTTAKSTDVDVAIQKQFEYETRQLQRLFDGRHEVELKHMHEGQYDLLLRELSKTQVEQIAEVLRG